jgi:tRNA wybutosine-synthesizing protein 4
MVHAVTQIMVENMQPEMKKRDLETYDIVSKRCVEKLYHQNEPSVYKPFVPKFKRRSPLVNRGYWLRMKAVDSAIEAFLHRPTDKKMVVLNLGCGYDPLPFRMRCQKNALGVMFIDIDNKELIKSKVKILTQDNQFQQHLHNDIHVTNGEGKDEDENIIFSSKSYLAVGCELTEINVLNRIFNEIIRDCEILFLTEYSTTYMPDRDIEALLQWAATFEHGSFPSSTPNIYYST